MKFGQTKDAVLYFLPSIISFLSILITLPLLTNKLDLEDFGYFYYCSLFVLFLGQLTTFGSSFSMTRYFHNKNLIEKKKFISSILFLNLIVSFILTSFLFCYWESIVSFFFNEYEGSKLLQKISICFALFIYGLQTFTSEVLTLEKKAKQFFFYTTIQSVVGSLVHIILIIRTNLGVDILFIALFLSNISGLVFIVFVLLRFVWKNPDLNIIKGILSEYKVIFANIIENASNFIERILIINSLGNDKFALFSHSKSYEKFILNTSTAINRSIWSDSLSDFKKNNSFDLCIDAVKIINIIYLLGGIFFATIGKDFLALISNDKFTEASNFACLWFLIGLFKQTNILNTIVIHLDGKGSSLANMIHIEKIILIGVFVLSLNYWGVYGLFLSYILSVIFPKIYIFNKARILKNIPFIEKQIIPSFFIIIFTLVISFFFGETFYIRLLIFLFSLMIIIIIYINDILGLISYIKKNSPSHKHD